MKHSISSFILLMTFLYPVILPAESSDGEILIWDHVSLQTLTAHYGFTKGGDFPSIRKSEERMDPKTGSVNQKLTWDLYEFDNGIALFSVYSWSINGKTRVTGKASKIEFDFKGAVFDGEKRALFFSGGSMKFLNDHGILVDRKSMEVKVNWRKEFENEKSGGKIVQFANPGKGYVAIYFGAPNSTKVDKIVVGIFGVNE